MPVQLILGISFIVVGAAIGIWDVYAVSSGRPNDTVSAVMQTWGRMAPWLPFLLGFLAGHLWWG